MTTGRKKPTRHDVGVATTRRHQSLLAVVDTVEEFLRGDADKNDLKTAVVNARLSCQAAASVFYEFTRISEDSEERGYA